MRQQYHILNGDALKCRFPIEFGTNIFVVRECLMEGNVSGDNLETFYANRSKFLGEYFGELEPGNYYTVTVPEFEKINNIPANSEINLWFEDDLFCQVNLWFVVYLIGQKDWHDSVYLVRPKTGSEYSFSTMTENELILAFQNKTELDETTRNRISGLWQNYKQYNLVELKYNAGQLSTRFPFIQYAVNAHLDRLPKNGNPGRPVKTLQQIIKDLGTTEFTPIFKEFCQREAIYGYGDWQVKKMLETIIKNMKNE